MRVLLDSSAFVKWVLGEIVPSRVKRTLQKSTNEILLSIVTPWEIALKASTGRLTITNAQVQRYMSEMAAQLLPIRMEHTAQLYDLPRHHNDPFDRMLIAQALVERAPLVSSDERFLLYRGLQVIWD